MGKVCKTHTHWPKHVKHVQSRVNPINETHLSPIQHKNVIWAFCQTQNKQHYKTPMDNAWTHVKMPQDKLKMPHGTNIDTHRLNGT